MTRSDDKEQIEQDILEFLKNKTTPTNVGMVLFLCECNFVLYQI